MNTTRQQKIERLIQKELSTMFQHDTSRTHGLLVTVSKVRISPDFSIADVYLSVFPSDKATETVQSANNNVKTIRYDFGQIVRHQLRIIPDFRFHVDDSLDYLEHIDQLLKK